MPQQHKAGLQSLVAWCDAAQHPASVTYQHHVCASRPTEKQLKQLPPAFFNRSRAQSQDLLSRRRATWPHDPNEPQLIYTSISHKIS